MKLLKAIGSGAAGAATVTALNEIGRRMIPHAPRMDVIGIRALVKTLRAVDTPPPTGDTAYWATLAGDLVSNTLYYSLIGVGADDTALTRGVVLGGAAGLGGAVLPPQLGLGEQPDARFPITHGLTVLWYLAGGVVAAAVYRRWA